MRDYSRDDPILDAEDQQRDGRPVLGICPVCGYAFHGESLTHYMDEGYDIDGYMIHEDCIMSYLEKYKVR